MTLNRILGIGRRHFLTCSNKQREGIYLLGVLLINIYIGRNKLSEKKILSIGDLLSSVFTQLSFLILER